jgi:hypothetical protein
MDVQRNVTQLHALFGEDGLDAIRDGIGGDAHGSTSMGRGPIVTIGQFAW